MKPKSLRWQVGRRNIDQQHLRLQHPYKKKGEKGRQYAKEEAIRSFKQGS